MCEKELAGRARAGDRSALEELLRDNYKIVYGYLLKLAADEEIARDFTQEVMVRAIMNIKKFKGDSKFSTWLIAIASNAYKDSLRKKRRISPADIDDLRLEAPENVEDRVIDREEVRRLKEALLELPEDKRKAFILKHYYNYSYEEIAEILHCPLGTVRSRLHYCIKKIQSVLCLFMLIV